MVIMKVIGQINEKINDSSQLFFLISTFNTLLIRPKTIEPNNIHKTQMKKTNIKLTKVSICLPPESLNLLAIQ